MKKAYRRAHLGVGVAVCFLCLVGLSCGRPATHSVKGEKGLVGHWRFDEARGRRVRDSSGCGNHGVMFRAKRVKGKVGGALSFAEPGSHVKIPCTPSLNLGDAISIEAWIRPQDITQDSRIIVCKNDEYLLRIDRPSEGNRVSLFLHVGTPAVTWEPRVTGKDVPALDAWQHVLAVWDGAESRLYVDGKLVGRRARAGKPNPNPYPVMIGNWEYPSCHGIHFGGLIDEVRIHNHAIVPQPAARQPRR